MLNISSVAVAPVPAQGPVAARVQPATPARASEHVSPRNQGVAAPVAPAGEGSRTQAVYAPPAQPPVNPTDQALRANMYDNAGAPERFNAQSQADLAASVLAQRQALESAPSLQGLEQERIERARQERQERQVQNPEAQLPPSQRNPVDVALDNQIRDLLPNVWSASRFAADQLIGDEAREAAQRRADLIAPAQPTPIERALEAAAESYQTTSSLPLPPSAGVNVDRLI
ncbi:DnaJ-domain-containing protein 1 [Serpentinimonas raichei]|uniref:DnaJ-domain-containing protein 1 n=1 Tax=Serpentinimonas raichei TaxID=1458425 RepID=A0A060NFG7_9BURK|nr:MULTISPECIES: hypothetical protein [Serpentinimonas]BAO80186.1 DnaJ-domain-containing protein 1 [Serpentinimonas raichei]